MTPYEIVERKLNDEMVKGQMHTTLRDIGRLAGGYAASGSINSRDMASLEDLAAARSTNAKEGRSKWREAVNYGRSQPVKMEQRHDNDGRRGFEWNDPIFIGHESGPAVDSRWIEGVEIPAPDADWQPGDMIRYLESVFEPDERIGIVATSREKDGKHLPQKGVWDRTRDELVLELRKAGADYGKVIGDTKENVGAWVRINPLDGAGCSDVNVTAHRHALIEADDQDLGKQLALIRELRLPCSAIVHSGGKSIHAIVRVEALDAADYRRRVDKLYEVCEKSGLKVDNANRNPSRLSRLPGVSRNNNPQYMIDGKCGMATFDAWLEHVEELNDKLPEIECLASVSAAPPPLEEEVITGVLRKGHKLLLAGPSKAAKTFDLMELCIAIAEGGKWHDWQCKQGPVLYVNAELSRPSCINRFLKIYEVLGVLKPGFHNIDIWNLRGNAVPLDKLVPKLIRRAQARGYVAVVIDPIYKVLTGDENSAEEMALFCNQFDRIALALGAATIYAHHHSKGNQGQKRSIDRSSGSGVFSRDPDAILDLIELEISKDRREVLFNHAARSSLESFADAQWLDLDGIPIESRMPADAFLMALQGAFPDHATSMADVMFKAREGVNHMTGWRVECNLREFATPAPRRTWFKYPIHIEDTHDLLIDAKAAGEEPPWEATRRTKEDARKEKAESAKEALEEAIEASGGAGKATVRNVSEALGCDEDTVRNRIKKLRQFAVHRGLIMEAKHDL